MDQFDIAQELEQKHREKALSQIKWNITVSSMKECIDCDEPIPELRRTTVKGCKRCIDCQEMFELKNRR